jgi:hypothetical protein
MPFPIVGSLSDRPADGSVRISPCQTRGLVPPGSRAARAAAAMTPERGRGVVSAAARGFRGCSGDHRDQQPPHQQRRRSRPHMPPHRALAVRGALSGLEMTGNESYDIKSK